MLLIVFIDVFNASSLQIFPHPHNFAHNFPCKLGVFYVLLAGLHGNRAPCFL